MTRRASAVVLCLALLAVPAAAATYEIDGTHSSAVYKIKHLGVSNFYGTFGDLKGKIEWDPANVAASSIEVVIAAESVQSRNDKRDDHIKSPDFLDAKQFPTITFKSKSVKGGAGALTITGDLTLHGVTREITVTAEKTGEGKNPRSGQDMIGFEARFTVDRTTHDMNFMVGPLTKEIDFILSVEALK
jgi:polyisoprenoid-binding protein YceI